MSTPRILEWEHPTGRIPEKVVLLGLGETKRMYGDLWATTHARPAQFKEAEVWTLNNGYGLWPHDLLWVMDDLVGEEHKWPEYGRALAAHDRPIITSTAYPQLYPKALAYPFEQVCKSLGLEGLGVYFYNSIPYILAYACFIGVKQMTLLGCDYSHPSQGGREADQPNAEYWCGFVTAKGMKLVIANDSTLMRARESHTPLYGYRLDPRLEMQRNVARDLQARASEMEGPPRPTVRQAAIRDALQAVEAGPSQQP